MAEKSPTPYTFKSGFVQSRDVARVIGQIEELVDAGEPDSKLMKWARQGASWSAFNLEWTAIRLWVQTAPALELFAIGPSGDVHVATAAGVTEEQVDASVEGPSGRGDLRDLRWIGGHLYAAGMSRQVYRREPPNGWVHRDAGVVLPLGTKAVAGFNALDGLSETDIFAVGFGGEIWRYHPGEWHQIDSPSNVVLTAVRVIRQDLQIACGQAGVLLRGNGDSWQSIEHGSTDEDLWSLEWYRDQLYVAWEGGLFVLTENDELAPVDGLPEEVTCRHLHANDGVMWSFGDKHVIWTEDGRHWSDATP